MRLQKQFVVSVIRQLYDDLLAQNYSNIENMNTRFFSQITQNILASMKT